MGDATSADELFALVLESVERAVGFDSASIMVVEPGGDALVVRAARGSRLVGTRVMFGPSLSWRALERREPIVIVGAAAKDLGTPYTKDVPFALCLPLIVGQKTLGTLNVNRDDEPAPEALSFLRILAGDIAFALDRMELFGDLAAFTSQLISQEEEQRRRLVRDIHDRLAPMLVSAYGQLQSAGTDDERAARAATLLRKAIGETRSILGTVRPATLDDLGLVAALSAEARALAEQEGWALDEELEDVGQLSHDAESTLYRVALEALRNAKQHAAARAVRFAVHSDDETLEIVVADDGHGFQIEQWGEEGMRAGRFGLLSMRERLAFLGGVCKVQSRPGEGTTVRIVVPRERIRA